MRKRRASDSPVCTLPGPGRLCPYHCAFSLGLPSRLVPLVYHLFNLVCVSLAVNVPSIPKLLGIRHGFFFASVDVGAQHGALPSVRARGCMLGLRLVGFLWHQEGTVSSSTVKGGSIFEERSDISLPPPPKSGGRGDRTVLVWRERWGGAVPDLRAWALALPLLW